MVDSSLFDKLSEIAQSLRKSRKPFGGIQLVFTGDFFQLPPVGDQAKFAFQSLRWETCFPKVFFLRQVYRQEDKGNLQVVFGFGFY